jgi:hypothetical protein
MKKMMVMVLGLMALGAIAAEEYKFDFGPVENKKVSEGITLVGVKDVYSKDKKFGWEKPISAMVFTRDLDAVVDEQTRDGICSVAAKGNKLSPADNDMTFVADMPDGYYQLEVAVGDSAKGECRQNICVDVNGLQMIPPPGVGGWGQVVKKSFPAEVKNGQLKVRFYCSPAKDDLSRLSLLSLSAKKLTAEPDIKKAKDELAKVAVPIKEKAE